MNEQKTWQGFRQLSPDIPFEQVISWVYDCPLPTKSSRPWWQFWR